MKSHVQRSALPLHARLDSSKLGSCSLMLGSHVPLLLVSIIPFTVSAVDVTIPLTALPSAPSVSPDLVSFSIEQDRWVDWAGTTERNQFFYNALDNLVQITHSPPFIQISADSEDHTIFGWDVQVIQAAWFVPPWLLINRLFSMRTTFFLYSPPSLLTRRQPTSLSDKDFMTSFPIFFPVTSKTHNIHCN